MRTAQHGTAAQCIGSAHVDGWFAFLHSMEQQQQRTGSARVGGWFAFRKRSILLKRPRGESRKRKKNKEAPQKTGTEKVGEPGIFGTPEQAFARYMGCIGSEHRVLLLRALPRHCRQLLGLSCCCRAHAPKARHSRIQAQMVTEFCAIE